eukprot:2073722-Lingulodinium_polyedra.AAC.1
MRRAARPPALPGPRGRRRCVVGAAHRQLDGSQHLPGGANVAELSSLTRRTSRGAALAAVAAMAAWSARSLPRRP